VPDVHVVLVVCSFTPVFNQQPEPPALFLLRVHALHLGSFTHAAQHSSLLLLRKCLMSLAGKHFPSNIVQLLLALALALAVGELPSMGVVVLEDDWFTWFGQHQSLGLPGSPSTSFQLPTRMPAYPDHP
jgi:hypothetical protein